jgi:hypothetical protein
VLFIIEAGLSPPQMRVYAGKRSKSRLKEPKIKGVRRQPEGAGWQVLFAQEGLDYRRALQAAVARSTSSYHAQSGIFGGVSSELSGGLRSFAFKMAPAIVGGGFFLFFVKNRGGQFLPQKRSAPAEAPSSSSSDYSHLTQVELDR